MSVWQRPGNAGLRLHHAMGVWLVARKLISRAYVPSAQARLALHGKEPRWYVVTFTLAPRTTGEFRVTPGRDFHLLVILGNSVLANGNPSLGFQAQIFDSGRKARFSSTGVHLNNLCGTAANPFLLREPYRFLPMSPILVRIQNLDVTAGVNNTGQVVLYGVVS